MDGRAARWAGQRERRRAQIVQAALDAIRELGPNVSTEQIAERAGIARPQIYRHFDDAGDLYRTVARSAADLLLTETTGVLARPSGTPRGIIAQVVSTFVHWITDNVSLYQYVVTSSTGAAHDGQVAADARAEISGLVRDLLNAYLGVLGASFDAADPLAFGLVGLVESSTQRWVAEPGQVTRDNLVELLVGSIWVLFDAVLRSQGVAVNPDQPLPELPS